jgi:hypothetical protein
VTAAVSTSAKHAKMGVLDMGCFWSHDWSIWGKPIEVAMIQMYKGVRVGTGAEHMQRRTCSKCNKVEERTL